MGPEADRALEKSREPRGPRATGCRPRAPKADEDRWAEAHSEPTPHPLPTPACRQGA